MALNDKEYYQLVRFISTSKMLSFSSPAMSPFTAILLAFYPPTDDQHRQGAECRRNAAEGETREGSDYKYVSWPRGTFLLGGVRAPTAPR